MWIAEETRKRKEKVEKEDFFEEHKQYGKIYCDCWCCEFDVIVGELVDKAECVLCPIEKWGKKIGIGTSRCGRKESFYQAWHKETDWQKAADLAEQIANLSFKKVFDITPEQAKTLRNKGYGEIYSYREEVCKKAWTLEDVQEKHKKLWGNSFNP